MSEDLLVETEISDSELAQVPDEFIQQELKKLLAQETGLPADTEIDELLDAFKGNDLVSEFAVAPSEQKSSIITTAIEARAKGEATEDQLEVLAAVEHGAELAKQAQAQTAEELESSGEVSSDTNPKREPTYLEPESERIVGDLSLDGVKNIVSNLESEISAKKFMGEDVTQLEDDLVAQKDLVSYLEQRDYYDERTDRVHEADTKRFVAKENANESDYEVKDEHIPHANKSMKRLISDWAKAEDLGDKTTSLDIQEELYARLEAEASVSDDLKLALIDRLHADMLRQRQTGDVQGPNPADVTAEADPATPPENPNQAGDQNGGDPGTQQPEQVARTIEVVQPQRIRFVFAAAKGTLRQVAERANDDMNMEKSDIARMSNFNPLKWVRMMKHSTVAKRATETFRAVSHMDELLRAERETGSGRITPGRFFEILQGAGRASAAVQESAMVEAVIDESLRRPGDEVIDSDVVENPVIEQMRDTLKEYVLEHVDATLDYATMSPEERQAADTRYQARCDDLFAQILKDNPNLFEDPEEFKVVTGNTLEIAKQVRQLYAAENGRVAAEAALNEMKISLGNIQIGPNSDYNTDYIEKSAAKMRARGVAQAMGGVGIVTGTWVLGSVLAYTAAEQAKITAASSGTRYAAGAVGGVLFGPAGAVAAYGGGVLASALIGRYAARKRAQEAVDLVDVKSGDSGELFDSELLERLAYDRVHAPALTSILRDSYLTEQLVDNNGNVVADPDPNVTYERRMQLRDDLTLDNVQELSMLLQDVQARLTIEAERYAQQKRDVVNLISTDSPELALAQRQELIKTRTLLLDLLEQRYGASGFPTGVMEADEQGQQTEVMIPLSEITLLDARLAERRTTLQLDMVRTAGVRERYVTAEGRRGFRRAGALSAVLGFGAAGITEMVTGGSANTIIDTATAGVQEVRTGGNAVTMWDGVFGSTPNAAPATGNLPPSWGNQTEVSTSPSGTTDIELPKGFNVDYKTYPNGDKYVVITAPGGAKPFGGNAQTTVELTGAGKITNADAQQLRGWGFQVDQARGARTDFKSFAEFWEANKSRPEAGSGVVQDTDWADYGTRVSERNELGLRMGSTPGGGERFSAYVAGTSWNNNGISETPLELAKEGKLFFVSKVGDQYMSFPAEYHDGIATFDMPEWAQGIYHRNPNGGAPIGPTLHIAKMQENGDFISFATVPGEDGLVTSRGPATISLVPPTSEGVPAPEGGIEPAGFTIPGYVPTVTRDTLYDKRDGEAAPRPIPVEPTPIPRPEPGPQPGPETPPRVTIGPVVPVPPVRPQPIAPPLVRPQPVTPPVQPQPVAPNRVPDQILDDAVGLPIFDAADLNDDMYVNIVEGNTDEVLPQPGWYRGRSATGDYIIENEYGRRVEIPQTEFEQFMQNGRVHAVKSQFAQVQQGVSSSQEQQAAGSQPGQATPNEQAPSAPEIYGPAILVSPGDMTVGRAYVVRTDTGDMNLTYVGPNPDGSYKFIGESGNEVTWQGWQVGDSIAAGRFSQVGSDGSIAQYPEQLSPETPQPIDLNAPAPDIDGSYTQDSDGNEVKRVSEGGFEFDIVRRPNGELVGMRDARTGETIIAGNPLVRSEAEAIALLEQRLRGQILDQAVGGPA